VQIPNCPTPGYGLSPPPPPRPRAPSAPVFRSTPKTAA
tara:strand:- start:131728 stop:131841 length:114 start_codon:yes stop_codon:yes gene_type:complete